MTEWTVVLVMVTIVGFITTIVGLITKFTRPLERNNIQLAILNENFKQLLTNQSLHDLRLDKHDESFKNHDKRIYDNERDIADIKRTTFKKQY